MIPHNIPTLGLEEQAAASRVLASAWVAQGTEVEAFENDLCQFLNLPSGQAVAVSSGSAALYLGLWALKGKDKLIGLPVYACSALRNAVGLVEGNCVYLDCAENSPNVDTAAAMAAGIDILIAPSMFGIPVELPTTPKFSVIEDIAQSIGASVSGERIGLRGDLGVCSFYASKLLTTGGQGGAIVSRDKALIDAVRDYRAFDSRIDTNLRFNFQMTDLQAAIGRVQLRRLPEFLEQREKWFAAYSEAGLKLLDDSKPSVQPARYRAVMRCDDPTRVITALASNGVRSIVPIEEKELLDEPMHYPNARALTITTVSLPAYPGMQMADVVRIGRIAHAGSLQ
ncbi:MAG: DegT/DnrJ/EryC1/StrS aminotransferase family protein [Burkholderiales bacterium]